MKLKTSIPLLLLIPILTLGPGRKSSAQRTGYTSSDVADAAERLTAHRAHMTNEIRLLSGVRLAGPAITLRIVRDDSASLTEEGLKVVKVLEEAAPGSVVVVALDDDKSFAVFGATIATLAKSRGIAGFVVDGSMRGLSELRRLAFPTFARGTVSGSAGGHYRLAGVNLPVVCGGIEVSPGDFIAGDEDGVAVAPRARYQEVIRKARELRREKESLMPLIRRYRSYTKALQANSKALRGRGTLDR